MVSILGLKLFQETFFWKLLSISPTFVCVIDSKVIKLKLKKKAFFFVNIHCSTVKAPWA